LSTAELAGSPLRNLGVHIAATDWDLSATEVQAATADKDRQDFGSESFPFRRQHMSVSGISSSSLNRSDSPQDTIEKEFQQLGQDLQSGNFSAAQSDFKTI
jgi:hypothetical protein